MFETFRVKIDDFLRPQTELCVHKLEQVYTRKVKLQSQEEKIQWKQTDQEQTQESTQGVTETLIS